jgi:hypothetical protein
MPLNPDDTKDALLRLDDIKTAAYDLSLFEGWTADQRFVLERISYSASELGADVEGMEDDA